MIVHLLVVGAGGFLGAVGRYLLGVALFPLPGGGRLPYGTAAANIVGCLLIGVVAGMVEGRAAFSPELRLFLTVGVLGGFTTFSTFGYETVQLLRAEGAWLAILNVGVQLTLGLGAVAVGWRLGGGPLP